VAKDLKSMTTRNSPLQAQETQSKMDRCETSTELPLEPTIHGSFQNTSVHERSEKETRRKQKGKETRRKQEKEILIYWFLK